MNNPFQQQQQPVVPPQPPALGGAVDQQAQVPAGNAAQVIAFGASCRHLTRAGVKQLLVNVGVPLVSVDQVKVRGVRRLIKFWAKVAEEAVDRLKVLCSRTLLCDVWVLRPVLKKLPRLRAVDVGDQLSVLSWNANHLAGKLAETRVKMEEYRPTVFCLQETMMRFDNRVLSWRGYDCITVAPSEELGQRGLVVGVRSGSGWIPSRILPEKQGLLVVELSGVQKPLDREQRQVIKIAIVSVYVNPLHKRATLSQLESTLRTLETRRYANIVVLGDFNRSVRRMEQWMRTRFPSIARVMMDGVTFVRGRQRSTIDHVLCREAELSAGRVMDHWGLSDHFPVAATLRIRAVETPQPQEKLTFQDLTPEDKEELVNNGLWDADAERNLGVYFAEHVWNIARGMGRVKKPTPYRYRPSAPVLRAVEARATYQQNRFDILGGLDTDEEREAEQATWRDVRRVARRAVKQEQADLRHKSLQRQVEAVEANDTRAAWRTINGATKAKAQAQVGSVLRDATGAIVSEAGAVAAMWRHHFGALAQDVTGNSRAAGAWPAVVGEAADEYFAECDDAFDAGFLDEILRRLKRNKAPGLDGVPADVYKEATRVRGGDGEPVTNRLFERLLKELGKVWRDGVIPDAWTEAVVVPIPKKGDLLEMNNFRGISLMNTALKVVCTGLAMRIERICEAENLMDIEQAAFRAKKEGLMQVAALMEIVKRRTGKKKRTFMCFIDFEKAYDSVPHEGLLQKMRALGFGGTLMRLVEGLYAHPTMSVRTGGTKSDPVDFERGVRQGDPASPILFNIYVQGILDGMEGVEVPGYDGEVRGLLFADDLVLLAESRAALVRSLVTLQRWASKHEMKVNAAKCGILVSAPGKGMPEVLPAAEEVLDGLHIDGIGLISYTPVYTYLGVPVDASMSLDCTAQGRADRVNKALTRLAPMLKSPGVILSYKVWAIRAILCTGASYASELWGTRADRCGVVDAGVYNALRMACSIGRNICKTGLMWAMGVPSTLYMARKAVGRGFYAWPAKGLIVADLMGTCDAQAPRNSLLRSIKGWMVRYIPDRQGPPFSSAGLERVHARMVFNGGVKKWVEDFARHRPGSVAFRELSYVARLNVLGVQPSRSIVDLSWRRIHELGPLVKQLALWVCGAFQSTSVLFYSRGGISAERKGFCPVCERDDDGDSLWHFLCLCDGLSVYRSVEYRGLCREIMAEAEVLVRERGNDGDGVGNLFAMVAESLMLGGIAMGIGENARGEKWWRPDNASVKGKPVDGQELRVTKADLRLARLSLTATFAKTAWKARQAALTVWLANDP